MGLREWSDRILIAAVGLIFLWGGVQIQDLTQKVGTLAETMSGVLVELRNNKELTNRLQAQLDQHMSEDRTRFLQSGKN